MDKTLLMAQILCTLSDWIGLIARTIDHQSLSIMASRLQLVETINIILPEFQSIFTRFIFHCSIPLIPPHRIRLILSSPRDHSPHSLRSPSARPIASPLSSTLRRSWASPCLPAASPSTLSSTAAAAAASAPSLQKYG